MGIEFSMLVVCANLIADDLIVLVSFSKLREIFLEPQ